MPGPLSPKIGLAVFSAVFFQKPGGARAAAVFGHFEVMKALIALGVETYDLGGA